MNLLVIEPWLSIRQAETLTGVLIVFTDVFWLLILRISYVNSSTVLKYTLNLTYHTLESVSRLKKTLNLLGIEPLLSIRQADALTGVPMVFTEDF